MAYAPERRVIKTRHRVVGPAIALLVVTTAGWTASSAGAEPRGDATTARIATAYARLPLAFEPNRGQAGPAADFLARGPGYDLLLEAEQAILAVHRPGDDTARALRMRIVGASPAAAAVAETALPGVSHYLRGEDRAQWLLDVPRFAAVRYREVYPGIDLLYRGPEVLEYDFIVRPGADPDRIRLAFDGAEARIDRRGDLVLELGGDEIVHQAPVIYQQVGAERRRVRGRFALDRRGRVGFRIGRYDPSRPLVIDPPIKLVYGTYLGGAGTDFGLSIAIDGAGNAYVAGETTSTDFPLANPFQATKAGGIDAFVSKLAPDGQSLVYSTYLGGSGTDRARGITIDGAGNAYVTGETGSGDFPTASPLQATSGGGARDAFVAKLDPSGSALVYSTYLGGSGNDIGYAIAVDGGGNAYVTGETGSGDFPTAAALQPAPGGNGDAFIAKLDPAGAALVYSTYLGGSFSDAGFGIALDGLDSAYVSGETFSSDFPVVNPFQPLYAGNGDAFAAKLGPGGATLDYSTFLGGSQADIGNAVAVDAMEAVVTGETDSLDFPTQAALQPSFGGGLGDAFLTRFTASGSSVVYSTYLGGSERDAGNAVAVDGTGNAYAAGETLSPDYPVSNGGPLTRSRGEFDAFVTKVAPGGGMIFYSVLVGGRANDGADGVAVDASGSAYITGFTLSGNFPARSQAFQRKSGGGADAFVAKLTAEN